MNNSRISIYLIVIAAATAAAQAGTIFNSHGAIDPARYTLEAYSWDGDAINERLGPTQVDDRPLLFKPESKPDPKGWARINPWELGTAPSSDGDYWSDSGQVGYVPDNPATAPDWTASRFTHITPRYLPSARVTTGPAANRIRSRRRVIPIMPR